MRQAAYLLEGPHAVPSDPSAGCKTPSFKILLACSFDIFLIKVNASIGEKERERKRE